MARSPRESLGSHVREGAVRGPPHTRVSRGFTLLELLVVVGILVIVAGGVLVALEGSEETAAAGIAQREMSELHAAIRRFRRDTGYLPKRGPFGLTVDGGLGRIDPAADAHWPADAPASAADRIAWFRSPANFYQLSEARNAVSFQVALDVVAGPGRVFNAETGRGYCGPYLGRQGEGMVYVGDALAENGSGDPEQGTLVHVPGVADPFHSPELPGNLFHWTSTTLALPPGESPASLGRPYLLVVAAGAGLGPRLVCFGPNGIYESDATAIGGDDLALFLEG